jgi:hypothetical protein
MKGEEFRQMMRFDLESLVAMNENKGRDYAGEEDALAFFREQAAELNLTPEQVWSVLARKHWKAIVTYCASTASPEDGYDPSEAISGRIMDMILYLFLLLGLVRDPDPTLAIDAPGDDAGDQVEELSEEELAGRSSQGRGFDER